MSEKALAVVTFVALASAAIMSLVAWWFAREERRRSDARVAALAAEIHSADWRPHFIPDLLLSPAWPVAESPMVDAGSFLYSAATERSGIRQVAAAAVSVLIVGAVAGAAILLSSRSGMAPRAQSSAAARRGQGATAGATPVELVALEHDRDGNRLTVRGIVRKGSGSDLTARLTAVVLVFDRQGRSIASGRGALERPMLEPGDESPFVVTIPEAGEVGRYRVSFRIDDRVVAHVDRRGQGEVGQRK